MCKEFKKFFLYSVLKSLNRQYYERARESERERERRIKYVHKQGTVADSLGTVRLNVHFFPTYFGSN